MIFISHSKEDKETAEKVVEFLEAEKLKCWITPRDIKAGAHWTEEIVTAIEKCDAVILILSGHSNASPHVRREIEQAVTLCKRIVPLVIEDVKLSKWMRYCISIHQWHDACMDSLDVSLPVLYKTLAEPDKDREVLSEAEEIEAELVRIVSGEQNFQLEPAELKPLVVVSISFRNVHRELINRVKSITDRLSKLHSGLLMPSENETLLRCYFGVSGNFSDSPMPAYAFACKANEILEKLVVSRSDETVGRSFGLGISAGICEVSWLAGFLMVRGKIIQEADSLSSRGGVIASRSYTRLNPILSWFAEGPGFRAEKSAAAKKSGSLLPLTGREEVFSLLQNLLKKQRISASVNRRGGAVHLVHGICGEAGIGKTRLLEEFAASVKGSSIVIDYHITRRGSTSSASSMIRELSDRYGLKGEVEPENTTERISPDSDSARREMLYARIRDFVVKDADKGLIIILDDAHKITDDDLDILTYLVENTDSTKPIIFILLYRHLDDKGRRIQFPFSENYSECSETQLLPLSSRDSGILARTVLESISGRRALLDPKFEKMLFTKTGGNPFFVIELVKDYYYGKAVVLDNGEWKSSAQEMVRDPSLTLSAVIRSSIDSLPYSWQRTLHVCAVTGSRIPIPVVHRLAGCFSDEWFSVSAMEFLCERQYLVRKKTAFADEYEFRHELLRDSALASVTLENRTRMHRAVAEAFESAFPGNENFYQAIATHWKQTEEVEKQIEWGRKALDVCLRNFSYSEAVDWINYLQEIEEAPPSVLLIEKSKILGYLGRNPERVEMLEEVLSSTDKFRSADIVAQLQLHLGQALHKMGEIRKAESHLSEAVSLLELLSDTFLVAEIQLSYGSLLVDKGDFDQASELLDAAGKVFTDQQDPRGDAKVNLTKGELRLRKCLMKESIAYCEKGYEAAISCFSKDVQLDCSFCIGRASLQLGEFEVAEKYFSECAEIASELGYRTQESIAIRSIGAVLHTKGDCAQALKKYKLAYSIAKEIGDRVNMGAALKNMSYIYSGMNDFENALAVLEESRQLAEESGDSKSLSESLLVLAAFHESTGASEEAISVYDRCIGVSIESGNLPIEAMARGNMANCYQKLGRLDEALPLMKEVVKQLTSLNQKTTLVCTLTNLAVVQIHLGMLMDAKESLDNAEKLISETGDRFYLANWYTTYGDYHIHASEIENAYEFCKKGYDTACSFGSPPNVKGYSGTLYCYCILKKEKNLTEAEELLRDLQELTELGNIPQETNILLLKGMIAAERGNLNEAQELYQKACINVDSYGLPKHYLVALDELEALVNRS